MTLNRDFLEFFNLLFSNSNAAARYQTRQIPKGKGYMKKKQTLSDAQHSFLASSALPEIEMGQLNFQ